MTLPTTDTGTVVHLGPAEQWFCSCSSIWGGVKIKTESFCKDCGDVAPWASVKRP